ncbi:MAG: serine protease Do, partial [Limisphaerales bacterium]
TQVTQNSNLQLQNTKTMKESKHAFGPRMRAFVMGVAVVALGCSLTVSAFSGDAKKSKETVARVEVDHSPIDRQGDLTTSFAPVVKKVGPSVVNVYTTSKAQARNTAFGSGVPDDPMFRRFFGDRFESQRSPMPAPKRRGAGSGVIVTKDGYILTNHHVVEGAEEIRVVLTPDKREFAAKVVGSDSKTDIAVLKVDAKDLPYLTLGDSEQLEIGDLVLALGNPFGIGQTVTMGMVSAKGRAALGQELEYQDFIQTDAAINPGNSGGALVDAKGRLIGINTAILSRTGANNGIGFAVPVNLARDVMENLIEHGRVVRGFLGVMIQDVDPDLAKAFDLDDREGALVSQVEPDGAADQAGLQTGDVIVQFGGEKVTDSRSLKLRVAGTSPRTKTVLTIVRDGKEKEVTVKLRELPGEEMAATGSRENARSDKRLQGVEVSNLEQDVRRQLRIPSSVEGALVSNVDPGSAAYESGLRRGDVILEINRESISGADEAIELSKNLEDDRTLLRIWSRGGSRYLVVDEGKVG